MNVSHEQFRLDNLDSNYLPPSKLYDALESIKGDKRFQVDQLTKSIEGRSIPVIRFGTGRGKLVFWTQMHGNEATATRAFLDVFNALQNEQFDRFWNEVLSKLSVVVVPMLNPDGSERYQRANALNIDLNRDAVSPICPESKALKELIMQEKPDLGVNMHDQRNLFNVEGTANPATIAFLSPSYNESKSMNKNREAGMQLISSLNRMCQQHISGHVSRFSDEYYPRSFGDNIQKWGFNNILIESGAYPNDPNREVARRVNYYLILQIMEMMATESYIDMSLRSYDDIPRNDKKLFDLLLKRAAVTFNNQEFTLDIGLRYKEELKEGKLVQRWTVSEIGDLTGYFGYLEPENEHISIKLSENHQITPNKVAHFSVLIDSKERFTFENGIRVL